MKTKDAIEYYGSSRALADALRITKGAVSHWGELIPERNALYLERLTNGELKYSPQNYGK